MIRFNENAWNYIEEYLPAQENVKRAVLSDFIWFMKRPVKYKDDATKIKDYIHHLHLKRENSINIHHVDENLFIDIDIPKIESELFAIYLNDKLLYYPIDKEVEAFTTMIGSELPYYVIQSHQIHSGRVEIVDRHNMTREDLEGVDAIMTNLIDCPIGVRTADCVPVLLYDPVKRVIAAVHSGWRGTVLRISQKTINEMIHHYGTNPSDLRAVIGPSIGPDAFIVHDDVESAFSKAGFPMELICKQHNKDEFTIDLWKANKWILEKAGVKPANIHISGIYTYTRHDDFYSARYEHNNKCGRNINVIRIKPICGA